VNTPDTVDGLICIVKRSRVCHPHGTEKSAFLTVQLLTLSSKHMLYIGS